MDNIVIKKINEELIKRQEQINGTEFENLCYPIFELLVKPKIAYHKGHNFENKPVGYTVDFFTHDLKIAGQCGTNKDVFKKIDEDIRKSIEFQDNMNIVYIFVNEYYTGQKLKELIEELNSKYGKNIIVYDSHKIAEFIYENPTNKILEQVKKYLGEDIFDLIVNSKIVSFLPSFEKEKYFSRKTLEDNIKEKLFKENLIILKGISGIGKSTLAKKIAYDLEQNYDYVFWVDENSLKDSLNLTNVLINNKNINLEYYIKKFKILIIFDNLQDSSYINEFKENNNNKLSSLIVTTKLDFSDESLCGCYFDIPFFTNSEKREFLKLDEVEKIPGIPLILKVLMPYKDCIDELLEQIYDLDDDLKAKKIIKRILYQIDNENEIKLLCNFVYFNKRYLFVDFVRFNKLFTKTLSLRNRFILEQNGDFFEMHEAIFLVIKSFLNENNYCNKQEFEKNLLTYLEQKLEDEDLTYYIFIHFYNNELKNIYYSTQNIGLKKYLLYILVQNRWSNEGEWFLNEIRNVQLDFRNDIDYYLLIEKEEIFLFLNKEKDDYENILKETIQNLEKLLNHEICNAQLKIDIKHHLAKTYYKLGKYDNTNYKNAHDLFLEIINKCESCYKSKLQLFRILSQEKVKNDDLLKQLIEEFINLSKTENWKYLTVVLDFYKDILKDKFRNYHPQVLKNDFLTYNIIKALEQDIDQVYEVLKNIITNLKWKYKEAFENICNYIDIYIKKINIENLNALNKKKALSVIVGECNCNKGFYLKLLENIKLELDDYDKLQQTRILNYIQEYKIALELLETIDLDNFSGKEFVFQQYAKAFYGIGECQKAYEYIEKALNTKGLKEYYKSAFEKDKQKIENCLKNEAS